MRNTENKSDLNSPLMLKETYNQTIEYLYNRLPVFQHVGATAYKPGLDNSIRLMKSLNNPQNNYRTIHIAGTNGKGSVSHFLAAILQKSGYKVGLYTSPHLVDFGERIRVNGQMIDQQYVVNFVATQQELFNEIEPSFFEATMAMAFQYFADCQVDMAIIEVGLGGRLDSTNIIQPELSVITNISFDHVEFLGDTLEKIAFEKAGIIKPSTPVVIGELQPETQPVFEQKAKEEKAPIYFAEEKYASMFVEYKVDKMCIKISDNKVYTIGLNGKYQLKNIVTTLTAVDQLRMLDVDISDEALRNGLENVVKITGLQGRWQVLQQNPVVVCDTGHNQAGILQVTEQLKIQKYKSLRIVFGMVNDKDISTVLALLPVNAIYYFTQANIVRAFPAEKMLVQAKSYGLNGRSYNSVKQAVNAAVEEASTEDFIFIGGSNFVVGEALSNWTSEK